MKKLFITAIIVLTGLSDINAQTAQKKSSQKTIDLPLRNGVEFPVYFRKGLPLDAPRARYQGFRQETQILKKGSIRYDGGKTLESDIIFERDVEIILRDGTKIYTDIFRPAKEGNYPTILAWSPYGKEIGGLTLDDTYNRTGVPEGATSYLEKFEGPDPAYWVNQGYVIVNPDSRGVYSSEGELLQWGHTDAKDGYDVIEWIAEQRWSNGKVGMSGNSWLTIAQWSIASERPPHLVAIAPWEGASDQYREVSLRGGIPAPEFPEMITETFASKGYVEDQPRMIVSYPFMNDYWEDKAPILENIEIPAYVVASYTNAAHTKGSFEGWNRISSKDKWLRVHNTHEWHDYYTPENVKDLTKFFDYYLKGEKNDWKSTPKVRLSVLNPGGKDIINRVENEFPLARTQYKKLYLDTSSKQLRDYLEGSESNTEYNSESASNSINFRYQFKKDTEITGYMKLRVWVEAVGNDDMDLAVKVEKLSPSGTLYTNTETPDAKATGLMRVSMRETDPARSSKEKPYYYFRQEMKLKKGEVVPVDIEIWPMGVFYRAGEYLQLTISAYTPSTDVIPFGSAKIEVPVKAYTYTPGEKVEKVSLGGHNEQVANPNDIVKSPKTHNKGIHRFYSGGKYDSYLYVPVVPKK